MVYRGRPSRACFACRGRRIKCDRQRPTCSQCKRMKIACPGYRNPLDEDFRDESASVAKKAQQIYKKKESQESQAKRSSPKVMGSGPATQDIVRFEDVGADCFAFVQCDPLQIIEEAAIAQFMTSYTPGGQFDYLPKLYAETQTSTSSLLPITIRAVSLAVLSRELGNTNVLSIARKTYATALSDTNKALMQPTIAVQDSTLISVLLLSLFEALVCRGLGTPSNWTTHTRGALMLLRLRGENQFQTELGRHLFRQVCNVICVDCLSKKTRLPSDLLDLVSIAKALHDKAPFDEAHVLRLWFAGIIGEVTELTSVLWEGQSLPVERVSKALRLDQMCEWFTSQLPSSYQFEIIPAPPSVPHAAIYGDTVHNYPNMRAFKMWNSARMLRILLNEIIHRNASVLEASCVPLVRPATDDDWTVIRRRAAQNIEAAAIGICNGIPQFTCPSAHPFATSNCPIPRQAAAASLLWPLSAVIGADIAPASAREFATERLRWMSKEFRVPQAESVVSCGNDVDALRNGLHMFYVS